MIVRMPKAAPPAALSDVRQAVRRGDAAILQPRCADVDLGRWLTGQYRDSRAAGANWTRTRRRSPTTARTRLDRSAGILYGLAAAAACRAVPR